MGIDAEGDRWVGVAESGGDDVDWDTGEEQRWSFEAHASETRGRPSPCQ
jgi:hypothetical protein